MLLTDDEILSKSQDHFAKIANVRDNDIDWDKWANDFARAVEAAILAKLASAKLPEPVVQRTKESKEKTLDDWFYASNPAYTKVHSTWKWEGLHTAYQLRQAFAQGAASQLSAEPAAKQFQTQDGGWHPFLDLQHEEHTIADGRWPIRELFTLKEPK